MKTSLLRTSWPTIGMLAVTFLAGDGCVSIQRTDASSPPTAATGSQADEEPLEIIDAHIHTNFYNKPFPGSLAMDSREGLAAEMRENHVVGAVSMNHAGDPFVDLSELNIVNCIGLPGKVEVEQLDAALAAGTYRCIKIYLGYVHQWASDPAYEPAYQLAEKYKVPVVFHTGDTDSPKAKLKFADPLTIDEVAVDHPRVTFVLAHAGNPWIQSAAEVAYKNPNVVLDGSAFLVGDLEQLTPQQIDTYAVGPIRYIFDYVGDPKKMMFGTDWPLTKWKPYIALFKRAIPKQHWKAVFHDNAARVFGFAK